MCFMMCECEFCIKCKACGHKSDEHMCGDGPCFVKNCPCTSFDNLWEQKKLEDFAEIDLGENKSR